MTTQTQFIYNEGIGIDFGTSSIRIAFTDNSGTHLVPLLETQNNDDCYSMPSMIYLDPHSDQIRIGYAAKEQLALHPHQTLFNLKSLFIWDDETTLQNHHDISPTFPFKIVYNSVKFALPHIEIEHNRMEQRFPPHHLMAMLIKNVTQIAERYLGRQIAKVVVSIPFCLCWETIL